MAMPNGDMHFFTYSEKGGGAIRYNNPPEIPGSIPYIHVADCQASYDKALKEGAEEMLSPTKVMEGVTVAIVRAPGGRPDRTVRTVVGGRRLSRRTVRHPLFIDASHPAKPTRPSDAGGARSGRPACNACQRSGRSGLRGRKAS